INDMTCDSIVQFYPCLTYNINNILMEFVDIFYNCQSQSSSFLFSRTTFIYSIKTFKESRKVILGYPTTIVIDSYKDFILQYIKGYFSSTVKLAILYRVRNQVDKHIMDLFTIGIYFDSFRI